VFPRHFFRKLRAQTSQLGEVRLAIAVFEDAVHCLEKYQGARGFIPARIRTEAEQWFDSRSRAWLFSFENVCSLLYLDPASIREQVQRWCRRRRLGLVDSTQERAAPPAPIADFPAPADRDPLSLNRPRWASTLREEALHQT
jgi:hypothetical protein